MDRGWERDRKEIKEKERRKIEREQAERQTERK